MVPGTLLISTPETKDPPKVPDTGKSCIQYLTDGHVYSAITDESEASKFTLTLGMDLAGANSSTIAKDWKKSSFKNSFEEKNVPEKGPLDTSTSKWEDLPFHKGK